VHEGNEEVNKERTVSLELLTNPVIRSNAKSVTLGIDSIHGVKL
jgi:hypothetical protein